VYKEILEKGGWGGRKNVTGESCELRALSHEQEAILFILNKEIKVKKRISTWLSFYS